MRGASILALGRCLHAGHVHLVVFPREREYDDSDFLKSIKETVSRNGIAFLKEEAPEWLAKIRMAKGKMFEHHYWQPGRGHDRNIIPTKTLLRMIDDVHENPVRRGLVTQARDWKWSSAGWFEGQPQSALEPDPITWDWLEGAS